MNFGKNLQNFRKTKNLSQEELADRMNVSRQAISKWESGTTYPEVEKLIELCNILGCSMDELVRHEPVKSTKTNSNLKFTYDRLMTRFGHGLSIAIFLVLLGVSSLLTLASFGSPYADYGLVSLLFFIAIATPIIIVCGIQLGNFKLKHPKLDHFYTEAEIDAYDKKFVVVLASAISIILIGLVVFMGLMVTNIFGTENTMPIAIFMFYISIATPLITNTCIQKGKYDIAHYNHDNSPEFKAESELIGRVSGIIMMLATAIFMITGFIWELWPINWLVFPIGGMLCGIVSLVLQKQH